MLIFPGCSFESTNKSFRRDPLAMAIRSNGTGRQSDWASPAQASCPAPACANSTMPTKPSAARTQGFGATKHAKGKSKVNKVGFVVDELGEHPVLGNPDHGNNKTSLIHPGFAVVGNRTLVVEDPYPNIPTSHNPSKQTAEDIFAQAQICCAKSIRTLSRKLKTYLGQHTGAPVKGEGHQNPCSTMFRSLSFLGRLQQIAICLFASR